jgi:hypothetical protein
MANSAKLDRYIQECSRLAQQMGIAEILLVARDPDSKEARLVASPGAKETLRETVAVGLGMNDAVEIGWPGSE